MSKSPPSPTVSFYYLDAHFILDATGCDKITKIRVDEKEAWVGTAEDMDEITINAPELFGGDSREGGITGAVELNFGSPTQVANSYLSSILGSIPAFRQVTSAILKQVCIGSNYYMKDWQWERVRIYNIGKGTTRWESSYAEPIADYINGVHVLRECLTNTEWGRGYTDNSTNFDDSTWIPAATQAYNEGLAFGWDWDRKTSLADFMEDVKKHVQCYVYNDRKTGKWCCKLTRKVTSTTGLVVLNSSNTKEVSSNEKKDINELPSQVVIKFDSLETYKPDSYRVSNASLAQRQNDVVVQTTTYSGVKTQHMAQKLGNRDIQQLGVPIYSGTLVCNREAEDLYPGDPFIFDFPDEIPIQVIMRVNSIDLGTIDKGEITIEYVQDVFSAADIVYSESPTSGWEDPLVDPVPVLYRNLQEASYFDIAVYKGDSFASTLPTTDTFITEAAASPNMISISAGLWSATGATFLRRTTLDFCFFGEIAYTIDREETVITIVNYIDKELLTTDSYLQIGSERFGVVDLSSFPDIEVTRGVLDTVPVEHYPEEFIFGNGDFSVTDGITYTTGETVSTKLTTKHPTGELSLADAYEDDITLVGRPHLPYPPGNVKLETLYWPVSLPCDDIEVTWATRNRFTQTAGLDSFYTGAITSEGSVTYSGTLIRTDTLAIIASFSAVSSSPQTLSLAPTLPSIVSINNSGTTAELTFATVHGLLTGDVIRVVGADDTGGVGHFFNGEFTTTYFSDYIVTYEMLGTPSDSATGALSASKLLYLGEVQLTLVSSNANGDCFQPVIHTFNLTYSDITYSRVIDHNPYSIVDYSGNFIYSTG